MSSRKTHSRLGAAAMSVGLVGAGIAIGQDAEPAAETAPSAAEVRDALVEQLKPLEFGKDGVETLVLEGAFVPIQQRFELRARGGDSYDLLVGAADDAEPFFVGRDGVTLAYTPGEERGKVELFPGLAQIHIGLEEGQLRFGIALVGPPDGETGERVIVSLDFGSVIAGATTDLQVQHGSNGRYRLSGAGESGSRVEVDVDPAAKYPIVAFRATPPGAEEPAIVISKIVVNEPAGTRLVGIPTADDLKQHFDFHDLRELSDEESVAKGMAATYAATDARLRMAVLDASSDPAQKAAALRDRKERRQLGKLVREAAKD